MRRPGGAFRWGGLKGRPAASGRGLPKRRQVAALQIVLGALLGIGACASHAQEFLIKEVVSREVGIHVGGVSDPNIREVVSREVNIYIEYGRDNQVISREYSLLRVDANAPPRIENFGVTPSPSGHTVTLDWSDYNQWAVRDVSHYAIYYSTSPFFDVGSVTLYTNIPGETLSVNLTGLPEFQDHFFAVVPVDGLGNFDPDVLYSAAYILMPEVISREVGLFVGGEPTPPYRQVVSREFSILVPSTNVPAAVTSEGNPFNANASINQYGGIDIDWSHYNEWAERDVVRYRIYVDTNFFNDVSGRMPWAYSANGGLSDTVTNLGCEEVYHVAVVAEDALGNIDPTVYSFSSLSSVCELGEVFNFAPERIYYGVQLDWDLGGVGTDLHHFVDHFNIYVNGATPPIQVDGSLRSYTVTGLTDPSEHTFRITTVDIFGIESTGENVTETPYVVRVIQIDKTTQKIEVSAETLPGYQYQLQRADSLSTNSWPNVGASRPGTGGVLIFEDEDPLPPPFRYYRFHVEP